MDSAPNQIGGRALMRPRPRSAEFNQGIPDLGRHPTRPGGVSGGSRRHVDPVDRRVRGGGGRGREDVCKQIRSVVVLIDRFPHSAQRYSDQRVSPCPTRFSDCSGVVLDMRQDQLFTKSLLLALFGCAATCFTGAWSQVLCSCTRSQDRCCGRRAWRSLGGIQEVQRSEPARRTRTSSSTNPVFKKKD